MTSCHISQMCTSLLVFFLLLCSEVSKNFSTKQRDILLWSTESSVSLLLFSHLAPQTSRMLPTDCHPMGATVLQWWSHLCPGKISAKTYPIAEPYTWKEKWKSTLKWENSVCAVTYRRAGWETKQKLKEKQRWSFKEEPFHIISSPLIFFPSLARIYERLLCTNIIITSKKYQCRVP